jgi:hypothetical protein
MMREPDSGGWSFWEGQLSSFTREQVRSGFIESGEFIGDVASIVNNGSIFGAVSSLASARMDAKNQSSDQLIARDAGVGRDACEFARSSRPRSRTWRIVFFRGKLDCLRSLHLFRCRQQFVESAFGSVSRRFRNNTSTQRSDRMFISCSLRLGVASSWRRFMRFSLPNAH